MQELTFEDVLTHYQMKVREVSDGMDTLKTILAKVQTAIESGYNGASSDALKDKLETVRHNIVKTQSQISEALVKLSALEQAYAEETENGMNVV